MLVFVHGWSCDSRYWRAQIPYFSQKYRIALVDLAGHGHSGFGRSNYTMGSFGEDVLAVVEALGAEKVILIGHSMGGIVIAEAARLMPEKVLGLIGVDTLVGCGVSPLGGTERGHARPLWGRLSRSLSGVREDHVISPY